jgi:hypothetical protein
MAFSLPGTLPKSTHYPIQETRGRAGFGHPNLPAVGRLALWAPRSGLSGKWRFRK